MKMKLSQAVAFLLALGFTKAPTWDAEKVKSRLAQIPGKVEESEVPKEFASVYADLVQAGGEVGLVGDEEGGASPKSKRTGVKPPKSTALKGRPAKEVAKAAKEVITRPAAEKDAFGCRKGSISAKVNSVLSEDWQDEDTVVEKSGVTRDQARGRLYYAVEKGVFEHRRLLQYRLVPTPPKKKQK